MRYFTEIESDFFLPVNDEKSINHEFENSKLPKWFYDKYRYRYSSFLRLSKHRFFYLHYFLKLL